MREVSRGGVGEKKWGTKKSCCNWPRAEEFVRVEAFGDFSKLDAGRATTDEVFGKRLHRLLKTSSLSGLHLGCHQDL